MGPLKSPDIAFNSLLLGVEVYTFFYLSLPLPNHWELAFNSCNRMLVSQEILTKIQKKNPELESFVLPLSLLLEYLI